MGSWLIMALNVGLLAGCCFIVANVVTQIGAEALDPTPLDTAPQRVERPANASVATPSAILSRNLFGAQLAGDVQLVVDTFDDQEPLTATKLPLRLLGTAAASEESRSRAAIEDEKTRKHLVVAVGDRLESHPRVQVTGIERTRVILDNAGKPEELALHEDQPQQPKRAKPKRADRQARRARGSQRDTLNQRLKELTGDEGDGISKILSSARIVPHYNDGEMLGMKVDAIKANSLFEKVGLQNGDVITEVNGIVIDRIEATSAIFDELASAESIDIAGLRGGSPINVSAAAGDLAQE